jgi:hypothetical protein
MLKRTVAAGAIAGLSAVGLGALSTVAAPTANAFCFGNCRHTTTTTNTTGSNNNNNNVSISVSNGNTTQSNRGSGNIVNPQLGLGVLGPTQASTTASIGNVSALNGNANLTTFVISQSQTAAALPVPIVP